MSLTSILFSFDGCWLIKEQHYVLAYSILKTAFRTVTNSFCSSFRYTDLSVYNQNMDENIKNFHIADYTEGNVYGLPQLNKKERLLGLVTSIVRKKKYKLKDMFMSEIMSLRSIIHATNIVV